MIELGQKPLTLDAVVAVARQGQPVSISDVVKQRIRASRQVVEDYLKNGKIAYAINTGFGALKDKLISPEKIQQLQKNFMYSHAVGVGPVFSEEVSRATLLIHANGFCQGHSGVRIETVQALVDFLNHGIHPLIPEQGSVGASGDLAPLSHATRALTGIGDVLYRGQKMSAREALSAAGLSPLVLEAKEGLALSNGTSVMTAVGALALDDAHLLAETADVTGAMSLESLMGTDAAFADVIHQARPHPGQRACADHLRRLTRGSEIIKSHKNCSRIQDAYSLRCMPQVHGASRDALDYAQTVLEIEMNAATDNPLVFEDGTVLSGGNFHGQPVALAMDFLGIAVAELADISERRIFRLLDPKLNEGLPAFLANDSGLNTGFMIVQYTAASLVSENKILAHPASVDSIPTCANQEDHVSMGTIAARKAAQIVTNAHRVIGIEALLSAQALDFRLPLKAGLGTRKAHAFLRQNIPTLSEDRVLDSDLTNAFDFVKNGSLLAATRTGEDSSA